MSKKNSDILADTFSPIDFKHNHIILSVTVTYSTVYQEYQ